MSQFTSFVAIEKREKASDDAELYSCHVVFVLIG